MPKHKTLTEAFYSAQDVAELMGVHLNTVKRCAATGEIPHAEKYLREWRFNKIKFDGWLKRVKSGEQSLTEHMTA
jgi:excisionase family DNA binding protein